MDVYNCTVYIWVAVCIEYLDTKLYLFLPWPTKFPLWKMHPQPLQYNPQVVKVHWYHKILLPEMKVVFTLNNFQMEHPVWKSVFIFLIWNLLEKGKITQNALFSEKDANRRRLNQNFLNAISFHFVRFLKNPVIKMIQNLITNPRPFMSCVYFQLGLEFY